MIAIVMIRSSDQFAIIVMSKDKLMSDLRKSFEENSISVVVSSRAEAQHNEGRAK